VAIGEVVWHDTSRRRGRGRSTGRMRTICRAANTAPTTELGSMARATSAHVAADLGEVVS
jgi:hypothetical protein